MFRAKPVTATCQLLMGNLTVDVVQKKVKNIRLSVRAPEGSVRVSAPYTMSLASIRVFIAARLDWIQQQQVRMRSQVREPEREYSEGERHYYRGRAYGLTITEHHAAPRVKLVNDSLQLCLRPGSSRAKRQAILNEWYRAQLKQTLPEIIEKYEAIMGVRVAEFGVKCMKTRWGTCNPRAQRIWLNLELAKKPLACLEYVVVHEMTHLLERRHNQRFVQFMDRFLFDWRLSKTELNRATIV